LDSNKNTVSFTEDEYSKYLLYLLSTFEKSFFEHIDISYNLNSQSLFYVYYLYICENMMLKKYTFETSMNITCKALLEILNIFSEEKYNDKEKKLYIAHFFNYYWNLEELGFGLNMQQLSKQFIKDTENIDYDAILLCNIVIEFTGFVKFHITDVLGPEIEKK
jgi:hypothetical protein